MTSLTSRRADTFRRVDAANQYNTWDIGDPTFWWPFGFGERFVSGEMSPAGVPQRPLEND